MSSYLLMCSCGQQMTVTDAHIGTAGGCVSCGKTIQITRDKLFSSSTAVSGSLSGAGINVGGGLDAKRDIDSAAALASIETQVVGVTQTNLDGKARQGIVKRCTAGEPLVLVREPNNPHDRNAVKVCRSTREQIGYLPRELAPQIAERLDRGGRVDAEIVKILKGGSLFEKHYGMVVRLIRYEMPKLQRTRKIAEVATDSREKKDIRAWVEQDAAKAAGSSRSADHMHYVYLNLIKSYYKKRGVDEYALDLAIAACEKQIEIAPKVKRILIQDFGGDLPVHPGFKQLATIREKQGRFEEAIALCEKAQQQGWGADAAGDTTGWNKRIERYERKLIK